jgi:DNA-3-methyladenine glycosylase II
MKARLKRHFDANDPVISSIVSLSGQYQLGEASGWTVFEALARSIASQQISGAVARKMIERLVAAHDGRFPLPAQIAAATPEQLRTSGFSFAKIAALQDLAAHCLDGRLPEDAALERMDDEEVIERCVGVRGIGRWTAQMLLMFHFGRQDVLPVDDFGVRHGFRLAYGLKGMPKPKALLAYGARWAPYRSAAAWYLWRAVDLHKEGKLPERTGRALRIEMEAAKPAKAKAKAKAKTKRAGRKAATISKSRSSPRRADPKRSSRHP